MSKRKISVTIDEKTIKLIESILENTQFRNRSHIIEYSLKKFLNENQELNKTYGE